VPPLCQPRGQCASVDDVDGAGSECSVLIYYSHNSHSLFSYSVDLVLARVDHGHMSLGYELSTRSNVLTTVSSARCMHCRSGTELAVGSVMVIPVHPTGIATAG